MKSNDRQTRLHVKEEQTLIEFLLAKMGGMSRTAIKALLAHKQVSVNGQVQSNATTLVRIGDEIVISSTPATAPFRHPLLRLVFEDDHIIVVEKREGLLTVATAPNSRETTAFGILRNYVRQRNERNGLFVVHRLDRETSGLLVFAKSRDVQEYMRDNWQQIVTQRGYVAVVDGDVRNESDTIISWLTENPKTTRVYSSWTDNGGKKSITNYRKLTSNGRYTLLELQLETGRTNQIRVHMAAIKHPVVGDRKYGVGATPALDRLALHAFGLGFIHPVTQQKMNFETPIPKEFRKLVE